jgi:hypothetical protein
MKKRVVVALGAAAAALAGTAIAVVPGVASGTATKAQLSAQDLGQGKQLIARMSFAAETPTPPVATPNASGVAVISIDTTTGQICWALSAGGLSSAATVAHIHPGAVGVANPPIVNLTPPTPPASPTSSGCTTDAAHAAAIAADPADYYVNVHTVNNPNGEIRGQLGPAQVSPTFLPSPLRAYDSRLADGKLKAGETRTISLATGKDAGGTSQIAVPPGATAAIVTLTITQTEGAGFVTIYSAAISLPPTSSINWGSPDQILSVATPVVVDPKGNVKITGGVNATNVVLDVIGYFI